MQPGKWVWLRSVPAHVSLLTLQAVDIVRADGGNWVVAAPTNSGKTAIFIELARRVQPWVWRLWQAGRAVPSFPFTLPRLGRPLGIPHHGWGT